jgi:hypothetical protein
MYVVSPSTMAPGVPLSGVIDPPSARIAYVFDATVGDFITIRVSRTGGELVPDMFLFDPNNLITSGKRSGAAGDSLIDQLPVATPGRYVVIVTGSGTTGEFQIVLDRTKQPPTGERSYCLGQTVGGRIAAPSQVDTFVFHANPGNALVVLRPGDDGNLKPRLSVRDPNGSLLPLVNGRYLLNTAGRHTASVSSDDGSLGTYTLQVQHYRPVAAGNDIFGRFTCSGEAHFFSFPGNAGQTATVSLNRLDGNLFPLLLLSSLDQAFQRFGSDDSKGNARLVEVLPQTTEYFMIATPNEGLGAYRLTIQLSGAGSAQLAGSTVPPTLNVTTTHTPTPAPTSGSTPPAATPVAQTTGTAQALAVPTNGAVLPSAATPGSPTATGAATSVMTPTPTQTRAVSNPTATADSASSVGSQSRAPLIATPLGTPASVLPANPRRARMDNFAPIAVQPRNLVELPR